MAHLPGREPCWDSPAGQRPGEGEKADEEAGPATKSRPLLWPPLPVVSATIPKTGNHSPPVKGS